MNILGIQIYSGLLFLLEKDLLICDWLKIFPLHLSGPVFSCHKLLKVLPYNLWYGLYQYSLFYY